jgi:hypothetical protein
MALRLCREFEERKNWLQLGVVTEQSLPSPF